MAWPKLWRQRCGKAAGGIAGGLGQVDLLGVEQQAGVLGWLGAVEAVAEDGCAEMSEVNAELVGAAGLGMEPDKLPALMFLFDSVTGEGALAAAGNDDHLVPPVRMRAEAGIDQAAGRQFVGHGDDGQVFFANGVALKRGA